MGIVACRAHSSLDGRVKLARCTRGNDLVMTGLTELRLFRHQLHPGPGSRRFVAGVAGPRTERLVPVGAQEPRLVAPMGVVTGETGPCRHLEVVVRLLEFPLQRVVARHTARPEGKSSLGVPGQMRVVTNRTVTILDRLVDHPGGKTVAHSGVTCEAEVRAPKANKAPVNLRGMWRMT